MRRSTRLLLGVLVLVAVLGWTPSASATGTTWGFRLLGPNTALATVFDDHHQPGDRIRVTGSGTFDPVAGTISAGGSFTHYNADGTVHMRGTWQADAITSFTPFGGPTAGMQGGILAMLVVHFDENGNPCTCMGAGSIPATVTSTINAPAGTIGGTTMGPFGQPTGGSVVFSILG